MLHVKAMEDALHTEQFLFFRKSCCLLDNVVKYDTAAETTDGNIVLGMGFACWITKAK
jgi:hypothetical protein